MNLLDPEILAKLVKIVLTDLVLAGDNALVIALATRSLPAREQFWGRLFGAGGAVGLRVLFVFLVTWLTRIPILQLVAGVALIWVAWKLVRPQEEALEAASHPELAAKHRAETIVHAVRIIIIADVIMSLDNVIAIASIAKEGNTSEHGEMWLVAIGLILSIPLVIWGSALISKLMTHYRWIVWLGGGVLGHVAGEIIFKDSQVLRWLGLPANPGLTSAELATLLQEANPWAKAVVLYLPWVLAVLLFLMGMWWSRRHRSEDVAEPPSPAA